MFGFFQTRLHYFMKISKVILLLLSAAFFSFVTIKAQVTDPPFLQYTHHPWVDSVLNTLTPDQRISQCIWVAGWSDGDISHEVELAEMIKEDGPGGIIFFQGTPEKQAELTNYYQKISKVPLIIAMDAEWGPAMRLSGVEKFPYQMTLGAIRNDSLIYQFAKSVAEQCRRLGVCVNLAPVADINNNPANPVINYRSFGEDRDNVTSKSVLYMRGLQENGVMATAKHFPGHGDTDTDSHTNLPVINNTIQRLDSIELFPFMRLIREGTGCIMVAHLSIPSLDSTRNLPSTLSPVIIKNLLQNQLAFKGLIITDAMNMQGVTRYFRPGEAEARAFEAGNDVVEFVTDIKTAIAETNKLIASKRLAREDINLKCRKVLALKYWAGLIKGPSIDKNNLTSDLNKGSTKALIRDLYANALTLLNNKQNILPLRNPEKIRIATVAINKPGKTLFQHRISEYQPADSYYIDPAKTADAQKLLKKLSGYDLVIAGVYGTDQRPNRDFGISSDLIKFINDLTGGTKTVITWFGNPYAIDRIKSLSNTEGLLLSYQENEYTEDLSAQLIFGGIGARGSLPVTINEKWPYDYGIITPGNIRVQYGFPESAGMSSILLNTKIDSIVNIGLSQQAFPGCEVMAARKGIIVFHKTYGYQTYDNRAAVSDDDLYDLASVTKVSATLPGLMVLDTEGKFSPDKTLGSYLPFFRQSDKGDLLMSEILTHQAGLQAWIPFWQETVKKNGEFRKRIFDTRYSGRYPLEVASGLFITNKYRKKIFTEIKKSPLSEKKYLYSDLGFIISPEIIGTLSGEDWTDFVTSNIYHKIGAYDIVFNPWQKYPLSRIVPTEYDSLFRKQQLQGTVHDEGAAMMGGISGHAGLFATANDLIKLMELYRHMGAYAGEQIIGKDVMEKYTRVQFPENENRRGLGFDKPLLNNSNMSPKDSYPCISASPSSFGHSGYTGTFVWVDPEYELSYIFLSNRVYPTRNNNLISDLNIRTEILQALYDSIIK
jgi:beta-N-acetylhexosaminidase